MVAAALERYEFWTRCSDAVLLRRKRGNGAVERLVDGRWTGCRKPRRLGDDSVWTPMHAEPLNSHVRIFFVEDLAKTGWVPRRGYFSRRLRCSALGLWVSPPPVGGEGLSQENVAAVKRSQGIRIHELEEVSEEDLPQLKEEAESGYENELSRTSAADQRANFFLGAAGLSMSLILANASLLVGSENLSSPWTLPGAAALAVAACCAIVTGFRAMQVSVSPFQRIWPTSTGEIMGRRKTAGGDRVRAYVALLLVSCHRESAIAEWKFARLSSARRWFLGMIGGLALLTAVVLAAAL